MKYLFAVLAVFISTACTTRLPAPERKTASAAEAPQPSKCSNVKISGNFAYAVCNKSLVIDNLNTGERSAWTQNNLAGLEVDDLAVADGFLFTIGMNHHLRMYDLSDPMRPRAVDENLKVPVQFYTGIDAANGHVVLSGGLKKAKYFTYSSGRLSAEKPIVAADEYFGRPDVSLLNYTDKDGVAQFKAAISLDVWGTIKWGLVVVDMKNLNAPKQFIKLESGASLDLLSYSPTNFPISAANVESTLYFTHWKTKCLYSVKLDEPQSGTPACLVKLGFVPSHMISDGRNLYIVDKLGASGVSIYDTQTMRLTNRSVPGIEGATNIAANDEFLAIASLKKGLVIVPLKK